jgi:hypothetical protein
MIRIEPRQNVADDSRDGSPAAAEWNAPGTTTAQLRATDDEELQ